MSPSLAGGHVIAGYIRHRDLAPLERRLIRICVAARWGDEKGPLTLLMYS